MPNYYDSAGNLQWGAGIAPFTSQTAASAASNGTAADGGVCRINHMMVVTSGAGVSAGSVQFEGSLDGTNWYSLGTAVSTTTANTVFAPVVVQTLLARFVRARIATTITGGTITAVVGSA